MSDGFVMALTLEQEFKLQAFSQQIDEIDDPNVLREHLKEALRLMQLKDNYMKHALKIR